MPTAKVPHSGQLPKPPCLIIWLALPPFSSVAKAVRSRLSCSCRPDSEGWHLQGPAAHYLASTQGWHGAAGHSPPSTMGISEWMSPRPAVIHWTPPGPMVPWLPQESLCCILPAGSNASGVRRSRVQPLQGCTPSDVRHPTPVCSLAEAEMVV